MWFSALTGPGWASGSLTCGVRSVSCAWEMAARTIAYYTLKPRPSEEGQGC